MKRNAHIIQISGFRGILMAIFVVSCLAAGFILFPAFLAMYAWNFVAGHIAIPAIGLLQGLLLWAIVAITGFIINDRKKYLVAFSPKSQLSDDEVKEIMERVRLQSKAQMINSMVLKQMKTIQKEEEKKESEDKENV